MDKNFEINDYLDIALRRKWFFVIPFIVIIIVTVGYASLAPKIYRATTLILVEEPELSDEYVKRTVTETREDRLSTIQQEITSRSFIEAIVEEFDLFAESAKRASWESMIKRFRENTLVEVTGAKAFSISYEDQNPVMAMKVTNRLAALFIERSLQQRERSALGTISFLEKELKRIQNLKKQQEIELSEFRTRHFGMLPEAEQLVPTPLTADIMESDDLVALYSYLRRLQLKYTDEHPEIIRLKAKIAEVERKKNVTGGMAKSEVQLNGANAGRTLLNTEKKRLWVKQQLAELTHKYEVTQREYQSLLDKKLQAELAASMEEKQKEQRFQILDQAKIPEKPVKPNRPQVLLLGFFLAIAMGMGLVTVKERFDTTFYKIDDLEKFAELPVIANISKVTKKKTSYKILKKFTELPVVASIFNIMKKKGRD